MSETPNVFIDSLKNFLSPVAHLLEDPNVTEIMINGPEEIWVEIKGKVKKSQAAFPDEDSLRAAVNNIAQSVGRRINDEEPPTGRPATQRISDSCRDTSLCQKWNHCGHSQICGRTNDL